MSYSCFEESWKIKKWLQEYSQLLGEGGGGEVKNTDMGANIFHPSKYKETQQFLHFAD